MSDESKAALSIIPEGFYDVLGILIPGISFVALLSILHLPLLELRLPHDLFTLLGFLLASYLAGHALYGASSVILPRFTRLISEDPRVEMLHPPRQDKPSLSDLFTLREYVDNELTRRIRQKWQLPENFPPGIGLYELCRNYVHVKDKERANFIRKEQAYGELSRSLVLVSLIGLVVVWFSSLAVAQRVVFAALLLAALIIFFWRYCHSRNINAVLTYFNFLVLRQEEIEAEAVVGYTANSQLQTGTLSMSNISKDTFEVPSRDGLSVRVTQWTPVGGGAKPVVIFAPGLKGFTNWGSFPYVCEKLARAGNVIFNLGFSRDGVEGYESEITRIDLAEDLSVTLEVEECCKVIDAVRSGRIPHASAVNTNNIFLFGHSLGGAVVYRAAELEAGHIRGIITWSSISHLDLWPQEVTEKWESEGRFNMPNARTGQDFFLGTKFLADIRDTDTFDLRKIMPRLQVPVLIAHGTTDDSVPPAQAEELLEAAGSERAELYWVAGGDHNFGAVHPFVGSTPQLDGAIEKTTSWIASHV